MIIIKNKFHIIEKDLASKIIHGVYPKNTLLPSENTLCEMYGTSRETVRKALALLVELGYIQKIQGKGSIVLDVSRFVLSVSGIQSFKELSETADLDVQTKVLEIKKTVVPHDKFQIGDKNLEALHVKRLRIINGEPDIIDNDYILTSVVPKIPASEAQNSLYNYFENKLHLDISYATKKITVEEPDKEEQTLLNLPDDKDVVVIRSETYLSDTRVFQFTESVHRSDRFSFTDFARRQ